MYTILGFIILFAFEYAAIYFLFRTGLILSGLTVWLFPTLGLLAGFFWWAAVTHSLLTAIPMLAVTFFAARAGRRARG